jgi:hypothetical protein
LELPDEKWHHEKNDSKEDKRDDHTEFVRKHIRHDHDKEKDDVGSYAIGGRSIFLPMVLSDMIIESSFQQINRNAEKDSHKETADIERDIIIIFVDDVWEIDGN